jgi:hypothetical protein
MATSSVVRLVRFDWAIKTLLRDKANFDVLAGFLSEVLGRDVSVEAILESESNQLTEDDKFNRVDLLVKDADGELIIVEVQNTMELDYFQRMVYGASKVLTEHIHRGENYGKIRKVIAITIAYFDLGQGRDYVYHGTTSFRGRHENDLLSLSTAQKELFDATAVSDIFPEYWILKVGKFSDVVKDGLDEWMWVLHHSEVKPEFKARGMDAAAQKLAEIRLAGTERAAYNAFTRRRMDEATYHWNQEVQAKMELTKAHDVGHAKGHAEGHAEGRLKIVAGMIAAGIAHDVILKVPGVTEADLKAASEATDR